MQNVSFSGESLIERAKKLAAKRHRAEVEQVAPGQTDAAAADTTLPQVKADEFVTTQRENVFPRFVRLTEERNELADERLANAALRQRVQELELQVEQLKKRNVAKRLFNIPK